MKQVYFNQAKKMLATMPECSSAYEALGAWDEKTALLDDPRVQTAINLLTPFVVNYKVDQVLKLLKEVSKEQKKDKIDPYTGKPKFVV